MNDASNTGGTIWVFGDITRVAGLSLHLPATWSTRPGQDITNVKDDDLVLLVRPTIDEVAAMDRKLAQRPQLVVLLDESCPAATIAAVLEAGADICVRATSSAVLASHLLACRRRLRRAGRPLLGRDAHGNQAPDSITLRP
ncbi:hypothetical protein [Plantactinospora sp. KLBMP9567]|uniref:hypothetical protein n=1 Tax=Plantactinospora sp. KLBMP9567 TaxID=3085900 RepID=UPI002982328C|nr:hypothetical protein [Plantactinospora sp. KLBMP9567]MDW5323702.1 hypothetical protein [Plantactinospora sp. KLBMP9567]